MPVLAVLADGRKIAKASMSECRVASAGAVYSSATFSDLKLVEEVIGVKLTSTTAMSAVAQDFVITKNVVGFSVYMSTGGTVTGDVIAIGF